MGVAATPGLLNSANLSENIDFRRRVRTGIITAAIAVSTETINDVQTLHISGSPTGGNITLLYNGVATASIPFNDNAGHVQTVLGNLAAIGSANVLCTGGPLPGTDIVINFQGTLGSQALATLTTTNALTGGASPAPSIVHTTFGVGFPLHSLRAPFAKLILNNPDGYATLMSPSVASNATVQADFDISGNPANGVSEATINNDISFVINSILNAFI